MTRITHEKPDMRLFDLNVNSEVYLRVFGEVPCAESY